MGAFPEDIVNKNSCQLRRLGWMLNETVEVPKDLLLRGVWKTQPQEKVRAIEK